ncbi:S8 family serine peptidase [bacterium]|nr:S8 family serine peptidase [bacterium]
MTHSVFPQQAFWVLFENDSPRQLAHLTSRADDRLRKRGIHSIQGSLDVSPDYLNQLRVAGFKIRHVSRFLNAASLEIENPNQLEELKQFLFIAAVRPVASRSVSVPLQPENDDLLARSVGYNYGQSFTQNQLLNIPLLHEYGYDGSGVIIAVFDTGFLTEHAVFDGLNILDQYDFVDNEVNPAGTYHEHGINVLSALGGYFPGELIGPAYAASFLLARTEDAINESRAEEDNWVAALEWADALGADIISSSLNYREFDDSSQDYPDSAIDGQTAIITRAANIAAQRGILVVNSASNEGPGAGSIWPPADSPHVLAVGAINSQGGIASFSSRGPTYDGRIKPDVVAMGISVYLASGTNSFTSGSGTSYATPLIAGLSALLLQAHPGLSPDSVISIFKTHADRSENPDNNYGYGVPNLSSFFMEQQAESTPSCRVYPNPSSVRDVKVALSEPVANLIQNCQLIDIRGRQVVLLPIQALSSEIIEIRLPTALNDQLLILVMEAGNKIYTGKFVYIKL